jgi:hypothetical protein
MTRCLVCDTLLSPDACFDGWCDGCAGKALADLLALRDGPPDQLGVRVSVFRDWHVPFLGRVLVGPTPFDATLQRLTDE